MYRGLLVALAVQHPNSKKYRAELVRLLIDEPGRRAEALALHGGAEVAITQPDLDAEAEVENPTPVD